MSWISFNLPGAPGAPPRPAPPPKPPPPPTKYILHISSRRKKNFYITNLDLRNLRLLGILKSTELVTFDCLKIITTRNNFKIIKNNFAKHLQRKRFFFLKFFQRCFFYSES